MENKKTGMKKKGFICCNCYSEFDFDSNQDLIKCFNCNTEFKFNGSGYNEI